MASKTRQIIHLRKGVRPVFLAAAFLIGFGGVGGAVQHFSSAATAALTFYAAPPSQTIITGATVSMQIRIKDTSATNIAYAKAAITFPVNLLQVTSISTTGSSFSTSETQTYSNSAGTITVARSGKTYVARDTDFLVATVVFKGIAAGTASVAFTGGSTGSGIALKKGDPNLLTGSSGGKYTIQSPPVAAPPQTPAPTPTPPSTSTPDPVDDTGDNSGDDSGDTPVDDTGDGSGDNSGNDSSDTTDTTTPDPDTTITLPTNTTTPKATKVAFTISHVLQTNTTTVGSTIEWQTSKASSTLIRYDANSHNYSKKLSVSGLETVHSVTLHSLPVGSPVYYKILATAKDGTTATYSGHFTTEKPKSKTFALVASGSGGGLGLVVSVLLLARLMRHRKLQNAGLPVGYGMPPAASNTDMSHAITALALEQTTSTGPAQAVLTQQPAPVLQQAPLPIANVPQTPQRAAQPMELQQRATIAPIQRPVVPAERPTIHPALPSAYTQPRSDEPVDMFQEGNQRLHDEGYPDEPQR